MSYHVSLRRYCRLTISPAILPHSFQARELSGAPPRALAQCSSEWPLSRFRGAAELPQEAAAPKGGVDELPAAAEPQPSQPPCCTAEPTRSGIASVTAESRCPPRRHTSVLSSRSGGGVGGQRFVIAVGKSPTSDPLRLPRLAGLQLRLSPRSAPVAADGHAATRGLA